MALVTGGARRIGRAIALGLAADGCDIIVHYWRADDDAARTAADVAALGRECDTVSADLTDPAAVERLFDHASARFGHLDVLVNNAAVLERRDFEAITVAEWDRVLAVNLRAPFLCLQHAARLMRAAPRTDTRAGAVVNVADSSALFPWPGFAHHAVSKAGLLQLTRAAARELAPDIRVNAVVPGPILPPPHLDPAGPAWARIAEAVPLGRAGMPNDVAEAVRFLVRSPYITGAVLHVDGGDQLCGPGRR